MLNRSRPLILAYNLWGKLAFNLSQRHLINSYALRSSMQEGSVHLCPVINFSKSDIANRSQRFGTKINKILKDINTEKIDIVAFSMAGLDMQVVLQENAELAERVQNFVTVGTPCTGTLLSKLYINNQLDASQLEKTNLSTGVHYSDLMECNDEDMKRLNDYLEPYSTITYHSIAGDKDFQDQSNVFKRVSKKLLESSINQENIFNDGLFFENEVVNCEKSLRLNADHLDLAPIGVNKEQDYYGHIFKYLNSY